MHSHAAASVESKMATMQHKIFCVREFIKTELVTAVKLAFRLCFSRLSTSNEEEHLLLESPVRAIRLSESIFLNHPVFNL